MSCDGRKWECLYCTYLNWQSAIKCTMCRSPKPLEVIEEGAPPPLSSYPSIEDSIIPLSNNKSLRHHATSVPSSQFVESSSELINSSSSEIQGACHLSPRASRVVTGAAQQKYISNKLIDAINHHHHPSSKQSPKCRSYDKQQFGSKQQQKQQQQQQWSSTNRWNWTCPSCYTQNWMNASSCKQCNTKFSPQCLNNPSHHHNVEDDEHEAFIPKIQESLKISELAEIGNYYMESTKRPNCSPTTSPAKITTNMTTATTTNFPQGAEKYTSRSNSPNNITTTTSTTATTTTTNNANQEKWTCPACTYDNWPRSFKCIMCECSRYGDQHQDSSALCLSTKNEVNNGSLYSQTNLCVDSVMTPPLANLSLGVSNNCSRNFETSNYEDNAVNTNYHSDSMRISRLFRGSEMDRRWLEACCGVVDGNLQPVEDFLSSGGDPTRQLSESEVIILDRPSAFDIGFTLIHLAIRFHQEDVLATLLSQVDGNQPVVKRVPSYAAPNVALEIRRHVMASIRPRKGTLRCHFTSEIVTFSLPSEIDEMLPETQETLFDEILDRDVQKELENGQIINWSIEVSEQLNSRLYALWNRSAGDCLLDSILQATWGIFDRDNGMRRALSDSLHDCATQFYQRWKESELLHARHLNFSLNEAQCSTDWAKLLSLASQPGSSLEQLHIFALAHILRRPIIVYGVKYVKSFRGEAIGFARYEGVYLPFLWETSFCWRWPIALGYTRGHFSALVPMEPDCDPLARVNSASQLGAEDRSIYLPLTTVDGAVLPIQFLTQSEIGKEEFILSQWLDVAFTENGVMVARQRIQKRPLLVAQMVEEWLNHYRRLGQMTSTPYMRQSTTTCYSSEGESDND